MEQIRLELKAKHFVDTRYGDTTNCAVCKAMRELTGLETSAGGYTCSTYKNKVYESKIIDSYNLSYEAESFEIDKKKAAELNYDDSVVRILELENKK